MRGLLGAVVASGMVFASFAGAVVYVDRSAPGGDGSSWATAFNALQPAIDAAFASGEEIWVAMGDYDEPRDLPDETYPELHWGSLVIRPGVQLYGGFSGDETGRDQRDWENNPTIINKSVGGALVCHVVKMSDGVLDGFTVTGGYLDQRSMACYDGAGGGLVVSGGAPSIRNCIFLGNYAGVAGAAELGNCAGIIENCTFTGNSANMAGAVVMSYCATTFSKCRFESNGCWGYRGYSTRGGAMTMYESSPLFVNCVFSNNAVYSGFSNPSYGGAISAGSGSTPSFTNCTFYGNIATDDWPEISSNYGGAIYCDESSVANITNCILWGNVPDQVFGPATVASSDIQGGLEGSMDEDPLFSDALRLSAGSPCIGAGLLGAAPPDDIRGISRPQGSGVDMGAYEMVYAAASFSANTSNGFAPCNVQFTDLTSNSAVTEWLWDFGDGETSAEQNPLHTYAAAGCFDVSLTVTTIDGTDTRIIAECVTVYDQITPAFDMDTNFGMRPLLVQFTDQSVPPAAITGWLWRFGDGSTSTLRNPSHIYRVPGLFSVSLTVTAGPESAKFTRHNAVLVTNRSGAAPKPWLIRWLESQFE